MNDLNKNQKGAVTVLFSVFIPAMVVILALGIDVYFVMQSKLDQQNIGEFMSLTALHGFYTDIKDETDYVERRDSAVIALEEMVTDNEVLGFGGAGSWHEGKKECDGAICTIGNITITFGNWDGTNFVAGNPIDPDTHDSLDPTDINAIMVDLDSSTTAYMAQFIIKKDQKAKKFLTNSLATTTLVGLKRKYSLVKTLSDGNSI